jgi:hypothetical protein
MNYLECALLFLKIFTVIPPLQMTIFKDTCVPVHWSEKKHNYRQLTLPVLQGRKIGFSRDYRKSYPSTTDFKKKDVHIVDIEAQVIFMHIH